MTSEVAVSFVIQKAIDQVEDLCRQAIMGKWQAFRAQAFLHQLTKTWIQERESKTETTALDHLLAKLRDEKCSEVMFESYRRVCLSASKDLGPRIIALLTVKLLSEERSANEQEELAFYAAEQLRDSELRWFARSYRAADRDYAEFLRNLERNNPAQATNMEASTERQLYLDSAPNPTYLVRRFHAMGLSVEPTLNLGPLLPKHIHVSTEMAFFVDMIDRATGPA